MLIPVPPPPLNKGGEDPPDPKSGRAADPDHVVGGPNPPNPSLDGGLNPSSGGYVDPNQWLNQVFLRAPPVNQGTPPQGAGTPLGHTPGPSPTPAQLQLLGLKAASEAANAANSQAQFAPCQSVCTQPIVGKEPGSSSADSPSLAGLISMGLSSHVPSSVVDKIVSGKYINLAILLPKDYDETDSDDDPELGDFGFDLARGKVTLKNKVARRKIQDFPTWQRAWGIYMSIYCAQHTHLYSSLIQYAENITIMATSSGANASKGYLKYDKAWRELKARNPSKPWDVFVHLVNSSNKPARLFL